MAGGVPYQNRGFKSPGPQRELPSMGGYVPGPMLRDFIRNKAPLAQVPPGLLDTMQPQEDNEEVY